MVACAQIAMIHLVGLRPNVCAMRDRGTSPGFGLGAQAIIRRLRSCELRNKRIKRIKYPLRRSLAPFRRASRRPADYCRCFSECARSLAVHPETGDPTGQNQQNGNNDRAGSQTGMADTDNTAPRQGRSPWLWLLLAAIFIAAVALKGRHTQASGTSNVDTLDRRGDNPNDIRRAS